MQRILVLGAGFAGLWSAVGAARKLDELGISPEAVEVVVVNRTTWHSIRVRNYEASLDETLLPLRDVLDPIGVKQAHLSAALMQGPRHSRSCRTGGADAADPVSLETHRPTLAQHERLAREVPGLGPDAAPSRPRHGPQHAPGREPEP